MYYMIIFVRHSVFERKLVILFLFIQKILQANISY